jgi:hypothetical protein
MLFAAGNCGESSDDCTTVSGEKSVATPATSKVCIAPVRLLAEFPPAKRSNAQSCHAPLLTDKSNSAHSFQNAIAIGATENPASSKYSQEYVAFFRYPLLNRGYH